MSALVLRFANATRSRSAFALQVSIALHALLLYIVSREPWLKPAVVGHEDQRLAITWIESLPLVEPVPPPEPEPSLPAEPEAEATTRQAETSEPTVEAPLTETRQALEQADTEVPAEARQRDDDLPRNADSSESAGGEYRRVNWNAERQTVVAMVLERLERESNYVDFSAADLFEEPPEREPGGPPPGQSIFESPSGPRGGPSILRPGQSRSRIGRFLAKLCNELSGGGIGLFGFGSICADPPKGADYFAHLRPAYMDKMPVCEEVEVARPAADSPGIEEYSTIKCRLVAKSDLPLR